MERDYKAQAEYAKSGRATCRGCKATISADSLRMGALVQSSFFDGKMVLWYHFGCFFKRPKDLQISDIKNFELLKYEDQERIKAELSAEKFNHSNFCLKANGDGSLKCTNCSKLIKDPHYVEGKNKELGTSYHVKCFARKFTDVKFEKISGFGKLKAQEKFDLLDAISNINPSKKRGPEDAEATENVVPSKKARSSTKPSETSKPELKKQSEELWRLREQLDNDVSTNALAGLLEFNSQRVPSGRPALLDAVADAMLFGALPPCPVDGAPLYLSTEGAYHCAKRSDHWNPCLYSATKDSMTRKAFKVPKEYHDVDLLKKYKCKPRVRLFATETLADAAAASNSTTTASSEPVAAKFNAKKPLKGLRFLLDQAGFLGDADPRDLAARIRALGGSILNGVTSGGIFVTDGADEGGKSKLGRRARAEGMRPVSSDSKLFAAFSKKAPLTAAAVEELLAKDPLVEKWAPPGQADKFPDNSGPASGPSSAVEGGKGALAGAATAEASLQRLRVKGGAVVDPDSGLEDRASVARDSCGRPLSAVLGMVDLVRGSNSYYKLQVLRADNAANKHWVFRSWGRIGTEIGGNKVESFVSLDAAMQHFCDLFLEKTGNAWGTPRERFQKLPRRFYPLDLESFDDKEEEAVERANIVSKLELRVQALMNFIFDVTSMRNALLEFEIDSRKMPLGKISRGQIQEAFSVLTEISNLLSSPSGATENKGQLVASTTRFYTLIPHDFGLKAPPLLDSLEVIKAKSQMLDDLLKLEVAYSLMKTGSNPNVHPLDEHYENLKNRIEPLDRDSIEFKRIEEYLQLTHAPTHSNYELKVLDIFSCSREGEAERFKALDNRMMLWHGSRRTNWAGILAQGLRIAPPEAPSTGYMFGKGIYFSDMSSKSANYCYTSATATQGCLLLCEVALGNVQECFRATSGRLKRAKFDSRKGMGATVPDSQTYVREPESGAVIPLGKPVKALLPGGGGEVVSELLYNEYIVYDPAQVKQRYLVWVDFKFAF